MADTTTNYQLPTYIAPYVNDLLQRGAALTDADTYHKYEGPRVAGLNANQQQLGTQISGLGGAANLTAGADSVARSTQYTPNTTTFGTAQAQQYMNPYQQGVTDIAKREAIRDDAVAGTGRDAAAAKAGAFGGTRHGVVEAEAQRNLGTRLNDIQTSGLNAAYTNAQQQFNTDQTRLNSENQYGNSAALRGGTTLADIGGKEMGMQATQGAAEQALAQKNLDVNYADFQGEKQHPYEALNFQKSLMGGLPGIQAANGTTSTGGTTSGLQDFANLASGVKSIWDNGGSDLWDTLSTGWAEGGEVVSGASAPAPAAPMAAAPMGLPPGIKLPPPEVMAALKAKILAMTGAGGQPQAGGLGAGRVAQLYEQISKPAAQPQGVPA